MLSLANYTSKIYTSSVKHKLIFLLILSPYLVFSQGEQVNSADTNDIFTIVEEPPKYDGGDKKFIKFLRKNSRFRMTTKPSKGYTVFFQFVVNKEGEIENIKFLTPPSRNDPPLNIQNEITRLLNLMPTWIPGKQNGRPVNVKLVKKLTFIFD